MPPVVTGSWYAQPAGPALNTASLDRVPPPFEAYWPHVGGVLRGTGIPFLHPHTHLLICLAFSGANVTYVSKFDFTPIFAFMVEFVLLKHQK